jgi:hypothetical protein
VIEDVVERRELSDEPNEERRELGEESQVWLEMWSSDESSTKSPQRDQRCDRAARAR